MKDNMKIIFLGTNGWFDTNTGNTPSILIQTGQEHIILDAGIGLRKIGRYIIDRKPIYLFLSHFHFDHIFGIHTLNLFDFKQGVHVYGPKGINRFIGELIRHPYTMPLSGLRTKVFVHDLSAGKKPRLAIEFRKLKHPSLCYGYRFTVKGRIITYCTDTGMCGNIIRLAENADLFISECSFKSGQTSETWGHMNPELAATAARAAGARQLALTHFDAALYTALRDRRDAEKAARRIFKRTTAAFDGLSIEI